VNGSLGGVRVVLGAGGEPATNGLGVNEGVIVSVDDGRMLVAVGGREVNVAVGAGWKKSCEKLPQATVSMRMNIIIKKRRMDIL